MNKITDDLLPIILKKPIANAQVGKLRLEFEKL
jgi:hypothetical protein